MAEYAILTAIGTDRPGLVDEVSEFIFGRGGNIEDSRMVNLRGQFAMMLLIGGTSDMMGGLKSQLAVLEKQTGLHAELHPARPETQSRAGAGALAYRLRATGIDQPGVVHRVSHLLREMKANIESLETQLTAAPYTGAPMFEIELVASVPKETPISELRKRLQALCDELNFDWEMDRA